MKVPGFLLLISLFGVVAALARPGWADLLLLAAPCALASLILLLRARRQPEQAPERPPLRPWAPRPERAPARKRAPGPEPKWIVVDGSNVLHWKDNIPRIDTLREVLGHLTARGFTPGVVFDANAGYLVAGRYQHHQAFGQMLGLPEDRVMVVSKGEPADAMVLRAARDLGARIVTNDRYRDWADRHPEVGAPGHLIRGGYRDGTLWLALDDSEAQPVTRRTA